MIHAYGHLQAGAAALPNCPRSGRRSSVRFESLKAPPARREPEV